MSRIPFWPGLVLALLVPGTALAHGPVDPTISDAETELYPPSVPEHLLQHVPPPTQPAQPPPAVASHAVPGSPPATIAPPLAGAPPPAVASPAAPVSGVTLTGVVLEKGSRDPMSGIRVGVVRKSPPSQPAQEAITDAAGRFSFAGLLPGEVSVALTGSRIRSARTTEKLTAGRRREVTYYALRRQGAFEAVVRGEPIRKEVIEQVLSVDELKRIPGTQNDALKAVQNLPGVARAPFGGGLLVVWGSAPGDTRVYADGVQLPTLYHFGGFRSTINSEFVQDLAFRPGGYGADYGRGLGGMVDITTRTPKQDRLHGSVTLDLIDGSLTVEGPITKKLYFAVGARVSWISAFLPIFNRSNFQISPFYWDYQLALSYRPTPRDDIDLFIFGSTDDIAARVQNPDPNASVDIDSHTYFSRARVRFTHRFDRDTQLTVMPSIGGDTFTLNTGVQGLGGNPLKLDFLTVAYNLRSELRHRFLPQLDTAFGVDLQGARTSFSVVSNTTGGPNSSGAGMMGLMPSTTAAVSDASVAHLVQTAPYAIARLFLFDRRLLISPQLRLEAAYLRSYDGQISRWVVVPEPRLLVQVQVVPGLLALKGALGIYHQAPTGAENSKSFGNPNLDFELGTTYVLGLDVDPTRTLHIEAQGFYKDLRSLVVTDPSIRYDNGGLGRAYGGELLVRQRLWHNFFGWIAYTLSRSERKDRPEQDWFLFRFDQTHILTLVASYKLPFWGLEAGVRFRYVTGNPNTPTVSGIRSLKNQVYEPVLGGLETSRLPAFQQLDLRIDKTFTFNRWKLGLYLDIQNLYNRSNPELLVYGGRQLYQSGLVTGIPFFPNLGVRGDF